MVDEELVANVVELWFNGQYRYADKISNGRQLDPDRYFKNIGDKAKLLSGLWHKLGVKYIFEVLPSPIVDSINSVCKLLRKRRINQIMAPLLDLEDQLFSEILDGKNAATAEVPKYRNITYPHDVFYVGNLIRGDCV